MQPNAGCMRKSATQLADIRRGNPGWRAVTWLLLLAFTLQTFVTQTHIHGTPQGVAGAAVGTVFERSSPQDKSPIDHSTTACPFCQAIVHAGAFVAAAALLVPRPIDWASHSTRRLIETAISAPFAHSWQSRAPPQV